MLKVAHIYASNAKSNSGDFMIGISTKKYFREKYLDNKECTFVNFDCRNKFDDKMIEKLNTFDYIVLGGGGLILPDSNPNKISCWQWSISKDMYSKIKKPIYAISIGYNLFYGQNMNMTNRKNNSEDKSRMKIFKENIVELIKKSKHFGMRHKWDIEQLLKIVGEEYREKIKFEFCPTIWYSEKYWMGVLAPNGLCPKNKIINNEKYIAIEIKDDREWRRYYKITKNKYYEELKNFVIYCQKNNKKVCYLSHDGSKNFYNYLKKSKIVIPYIDNSVANEKKIYENYSKIHTILCMAGHSEMISYGLGIKIIPLVSHPKIKNFCDDINYKNYVEINKDLNVCEKIKSFI